MSNLTKTSTGDVTIPFEGFPAEPINRIQWRQSWELSSNHYNPNYVMKPELDLLALSIVKTGWIQPILVQAAQLWIIDGFHRWTLSEKHPLLRQKYRGWLPITALDVPMHEAMMITVRINRAKGVHGAVSMSKLVKALIDVHGCDPEEVARGIGGTRAEVDLLYQDSIFLARDVEHHRYSKAWEPAESGKGNPGGKKFAPPPVEREDDDT